MPRSERDRAARFEAARLISYPLAEAFVRTTPLDDGTSVIGIARRSAVSARVDAAKRARLTPIAVDDAALALLRAFPHAGAIVDVGERTTLLVVDGDPVPSTKSLPIGGGAFTAALVASLGIGEAQAEQRKRTMGLGGAGEHIYDALVEQLATTLIETHAAGRNVLRDVTFVGNASRLAGLCEALERAIGVPVRLGVVAATSEFLPADVIRAASPDWALAYGLALWESVS
jgi:Tfp pilus assembly PilM family ATPase